ncbi:MAG: murein hydrolase activator EnvC family protein [Solitalea-like symbiont of Acarus siro]
MSKKKNNGSILKNIIRKLNTDLKLIVLKRHNFEETLSINLTPLRVIVLVLSMIILVVALTFSVLSFTFLKTYIPGCIDQNIRKDLINYLLKVDKLNKSVNANELFLSSINKVVSGKDGDKDVLQNKAVNDSVFQKTRAKAMDSLNKPLNKEEKNLRNFVEKREGDSKQSYTRRKQTSISDYDFFAPLKGKILDNYSLAHNKLWVSIEGNNNSHVHAILDGIIISIEMESRNGTYNIIIQHDNNIVSIYKNCKKVLKKVGNYISAGDAIAGGLGTNSGNIGYSLMFQLWYNGSSVNPNDFIKF